MMSRSQSDASTPQAAAADVAGATWLARSVGRPDAFPLAPRDLQLLAERLRSTSYRTGETLVPQGETPSGVWAVCEGVVELVHRAGATTQCLRLVREGETVGDVEILQGKPTRYSIRTATSVRCLYMSSDDFESALSASATLALRWASKLALQVGFNHDRVFELLPHSLSQRLARVLIDQAGRGPFRLPQTTLARMLGVHRSPLNQALKEFERAGLVRVGYRHIDVVDLQGLVEVASLPPRDP